MTRLPIATIFVLACLTLNAWTAEQTSFVGTWIYDAEKSELFHPVMAAGGMGPGGMGGGMPGGGMGRMGGMGGVGGMGGGMPGGIPGGQGGKAPGGQSVKVPPLTIEQHGNEFKMTRVLFGSPSVQTINADGIEHEGMLSEPNRRSKIKVTTKTTLKKNKIVVEKVTYYPEWKVKYKGEFEISDDGNTLTIKTVNSNDKSQFEEKQVYHRQASTQ